ncbi:hypothetical protein L686_01810 [Stutzerimonas stutzeri MF28]|nr:hypothetical protein L686_01810 [Stutzerimonas stutzeri MF28]
MVFGKELAELQADENHQHQQMERVQAERPADDEAFERLRAELAGPVRMEHDETT